MPPQFPTMPGAASPAAGWRPSASTGLTGWRRSRSSEATTGTSSSPRSSPRETSSSSTPAAESSCRSGPWPSGIESLAGETYQYRGPARPPDRSRNDLGSILALRLGAGEDPVRGLNMGGTYAEEVCLRAGINKTEPAHALVGEEIDRLHRAGEVFGLVEAYPHIVADGERIVDVVPAPRRLRRPRKAGVRKLQRGPRRVFLLRGGGCGGGEAEDRPGAEKGDAGAVDPGVPGAGAGVGPSQEKIYERQWRGGGGPCRDIEGLLIGGSPSLRSGEDKDLLASP